MALENPPKLKIEFAEIALKNMVQNYWDDILFEYNLQNFVFHALGILDYLSEMYAKIPKFKDWLKNEKQDLLVDFFISTRNFVSHRKTKTIIRRDVDSNGYMSEQCPVVSTNYRPTNDPDFDSTTAELNIRYFPKFPNDDVKDLCRKYLNKLKYIVDRCELIFKAP